MSILRLPRAGRRAILLALVTTTALLSAGAADAAPVNSPNTAYSSYSQPGGYAYACTHGSSTYYSGGGATVYTYERASSNISGQHVHLVWQATTIVGGSVGSNAAREVWLVC